ncbi:hypothetical protein AVEN_259618-1 [Araneus ventricosus]|uniref:Uncharacterized protein n=1 Tax=Araneus ventricosus TaxID=182803 RepID=A0A4Y2U8P7_ARAVE|nr:hypothetical protein AVEN_259618-1 [Araneus ventricosus]
MSKVPNKSSNHKHALPFQANHWKGSKRNCLPLSVAGGLQTISAPLPVTPGLRNTGRITTSLRGYSSDAQGFLGWFVLWKQRVSQQCKTLFTTIAHIFP